MQENKLAVGSGKSTVASRQGKLMVDSLKLGLASLTFHKPCYLQLIPCTLRLMPYDLCLLPIDSNSSPRIRCRFLIGKFVFDKLKIPGYSNHCSIVGGKFKRWDKSLPSQLNAGILDSFS